jgi:2-C-methyl-D-erythritol 2,4-cyclodiphosphate synthase
MVRTGIGFDAHRFADGRKLMLGGIEIEHEKGLLGHSDADVACHAIADALLGAAGLGDIGIIFPDTDPANKDIPGTAILKVVETKIALENYKIINIDVTIIAQEPKIAPHSETMKKAIAGALHLYPDQINVKGKTTETMGFTGRNEGIAALAIATIEKK